jgi:tripartite-type tricarboxylate transporter receptor subunit TctC
MKRREILRLAIAAGLPYGSIAEAQEATQPIRLVVPYAAGGTTDFMGRLLARPVGDTLGRTAIVENKPGAAGLIGARAVQYSPPDGGALFFTNSGFITVPLMSKDAHYDPLRDFTAICQVAITPAYLMVHRDVPAKNVEEFIAYAKSLPNGIEAANSGMGSSGHVNTMNFARLAGIKIVHVPYKGTSATANALISGEVKMQLTTITSSIIGQLRTGSVKLLAVASARRSTLTPEVPSITETLPEFEFEGWFGFVGPANVPPSSVGALSKAFKQASGVQAVRDGFAGNYIEPAYASPEEFRTLLEKSVARWKRLISELDLTPR